MTTFNHIPSDEEAGMTKDNLAKRVLYICTCTLCKKDYEIREGKWLDTWTKKGTHIRIKICSDCFEKEEQYGSIGCEIKSSKRNKKLKSFKTKESRFNRQKQTRKVFSARHKKNLNKLI